jgi:hypothetical protein
MHFYQFGVHSAILLKYRDLLNQTGVNIRSKAELEHLSRLGLAGPLVRLRESMDSQSSREGRGPASSRLENLSAARTPPAFQHLPAAVEPKKQIGESLKERARSR